MKSARKAILSGIAIALLPCALFGENRMRADAAKAPAGATGVPVTVSASRDQAIQGYSISLWFDAATLAVSEVTYRGTVVEPLEPEYFDTLLEPATGNVAFAAIFDFSLPYESKSLPPSPSILEPIAKVLIDVAATALPGTSILELRESAGEYPIRNIFTSLAVSIYPTLENGTFTVAQPGTMFRRGFVNPDRSVDISDAVFLFSYLFTGGALPGCMAAADSNGDRRVDLSDAIWILNYVFRGGPPPPPPFTECGEDPRGPVPLTCLDHPVCF